MLEWLMSNWTQVLEKILEHLLISTTSLIIGILIAVPIGILLTRTDKLAKIVMSIASVLQTLPALALLAMMVPMLGVGAKPAIVALVIYSLLPILRNTYLGIEGVDEDIVDASKGMGFTNMQIITKVEIPLAMPVIIAGIQLSAVYLVSWTTIASYIGAGGLGDLIFMGLNNFNFYAIIAGTIPVTLIALALDGIFEIIKNKLTPVVTNEEVI